MNLIANSGIQLYNKQIEINLNDNFKMYFYEWWDENDEQLKLEIAHYFGSTDNIWVKKHDLFVLGFLKDGNLTAEWDSIKEDFKSNDFNSIRIETDKPEDSGCFQISLNKCKWEKFENKWFPFPFFKFDINDGNGKSEFGPTNWCRFKLIPSEKNGNIKKYNILLAFDTRTLYEPENFEDEDLKEMPIFSSTYDRSNDYALCNNEFSLVDFCSKVKKCEWVDEYVLKTFHNVNNIEELTIPKPQLSYLAQYIFIIRYIQQLNILPTITLFSDKDAVCGNVDLAVDIGNSRTCAVLFEEGDFTKVNLLELQNFSVPISGKELNKQKDSFDMRLAFREVDFGGSLIKNSIQFVYPSLIRLGIEANELMYKATNLVTVDEKISTFSSPKRYLWDSKPREKEWEFVSLEGEHRKPIYLRGISEQLNPDGSLNLEGSGGTKTLFSRKSLMTFCFLEILAQTKMQINSHKYRHKWGRETTPRKINRLIITCPPAMSKVEQIALRKCAEDAFIILERFYDSTYYKKVDESEARSAIKVIPSIKKLLITEEQTEWIYDEATCSQFVFMYAEISKRYLNNCREYFNFYGKIRKDLSDYPKKSLTIGSVDIGAGTTDVMIAAYKFADAEQCILTPVPLFWESFYFAGDDLLKELIQQIVIEGDYATIQNHLERAQRTNEITKLNDNFFGKDDADKTIEDRNVRREFNLQISVPIVLHLLELLRQNQIEKVTLTFEDIFKQNKPTKNVCDHFAKHFGFTIENLSWQYDKKIISKIVEKTFDSLAGKISTLLSYYGCDIVLLSGRPTSLKPLTDLFLKYYAVPPNRLITMNDYRVGRWYPFDDGDGYFKNAKSIVTVGAMIGNYASTRGGISGFSLILDELQEKLLPTSEYFTKSEKDKKPFITPIENHSTIEVSALPLRIWCRQLNTESYPTRAFYVLDINKDKIKQNIKNLLGLTEEGDRRRIQDAVENEITKIHSLMPLRFSIERENYFEDKETLRIESVEDRNQVTLPSSNFALQIQSMSEGENYWLDTGEFINLKITHI
jgi:hypothetical protein